MGAIDEATRRDLLPLALHEHGCNFVFVTPQDFEQPDALRAHRSESVEEPFTFKPECPTDALESGHGLFHFSHNSPSNGITPPGNSKSSAQIAASSEPLLMRSP